MDAIINRVSLNQTRWDSGALAGLGIVVHRFGEVGDYVLTLLREEAPWKSLALSVVGDRPGEAAAPMQVSVDFAEGAAAGAAAQPLVLAVNGYAVFQATSGGGADKGHAVLAERSAASGGAAAVFDSRRLGADDLFAVTLARPGVYAVANRLTDGRAKITVAYPTVGDKPFVPPPPVEIACGARGFDPVNVSLKPGQGVVFRPGVPSRVTIELERPDDGGGGAARKAAVGKRPVASWRKPSAPAKPRS
jgi:hypothetical protein